ncbi:MAG: hydro protein, partial [Candidatus Hydrogenedentes bacterium]|nr:hydro protein [Candidatus Hydrogenedentota bacterium]
MALKVASVLFLLTVSAVAGGVPCAWAGQRMKIVGDSLVLTGEEPGRLCFDGLEPGSVVVRSTYETDRPDAVVYQEGADYIVDCAAGTVARTPESRIPDFRDNILFGQKEFDHNLFPGFGNAAFFVYVDYETRNGRPFAEPRNQDDLLPRTLDKLRAGGPFKVIAYGDSITAGGDASEEHLRFQNRWVAELAAQFPKAVIELENGATGGDSTIQGLARLDEKVLTRNPDLVLVGFGMNDHNIGCLEPGAFRQNLVTIVQRIREATGAEVILYSAFTPNPDWKFGTHRMAQHAAATRQAAADLSCAYADVFSVWTKVLERKDLSSLLGNNINHPNDFGHALYLEALRALEIGAAPQGEYFVLRDDFQNARIRFECEKKGRVAFLGGSITEMTGWRDLTCDYLRRRFPDTEFDFVNAAISSTDSTLGAFRLAQDVLDKGRIDLL